MDIVKIFENNNAGMHITIKGTHEEPLFRASDIAAVFEITNIRQNISNFDSSEKVVCLTYTPGGEQEVTFLTESGLCEIMFRSRKPIAKQFKKWVCEIIKEIRLNGRYEVEQRIKDINDQMNSNLLTNYSKKPLVYIGYTESDIIKFGYTDNLETRIKDHKREIKPDFAFEYIYESLYNREIERQIKQHPLIKKISKKYNGKKQTELIQLTKTFTIKELDKIIKEIKNQIESGDLIESLRLENAELKFKIQELENKEIPKVIDIQLNSMQDLSTKNYEIKQAVCYNFLVDLIAKSIINDKTTTEIKLSIDEIFELYKTFRMANKYTDPIYNETYEKSIITKAFNEVDGIKATYKTIDGIQSRAKLFYIPKISEWICENIQIPKRFRSIFTEISKEIVFTSKCPEIKNSEIEPNLKNIYSFLINLIDKYKNLESNIIIIKNTILTEEYLKFVMHHGHKKQTMSKVSEILKEIPGITIKQRIIDQNSDSKYCKGLGFDISEINKWIQDNLELNLTNN